MKGKEFESGAGSASLAAESHTDISSIQKTGSVTLTGMVLPSGRSACRALVRAELESNPNPASAPYNPIPHRSFPKSEKREK